MSTRLEALWYPAEGEGWQRRAALAPLLLAEGPFRAGVALRDWLFRRGVFKAHRVEGPRVISVGNLNVGGAGKTPLTIFLANLLTGRAERVAVLSRGYGRKSSAPLRLSGGAALPSAEEAGDEPLLIARRCPSAVVFVDADRVRSARRAAREGATALLLDDGFQHRRLARDVDIVVIDGGARFGNGHLLPRGPLREPPSALRRATLACVRVEEGQVTPLQLPIPSFTVRFTPTGWETPEGLEREASALAGREAVILTAIARPRSVVATAERLGVRVVQTHAFPDHHGFSSPELAAVLASAGGLPVITTEKDRLRLPASFPAWTLRMALELQAGAEHLEAALRGGDLRAQ